MATKQEISQKAFDTCLNKILKQKTPIVYLDQVIAECEKLVTVSSQWQAVAKAEGIKRFILTMETIAQHKRTTNIKDFTASLPRILEIADYIKQAPQVNGTTAAQYKVIRTNNYMTAYHAKHDRAQDPVIGHPENVYPLTDQLQVSKNGTYHIKTIAYEKMIRTNW